jgi:3-methyladenine DNA glycosylase AlkD
MIARDVQKALKTFATPERASACSRYFKTGRGEYGEGDCFIGVTVPDMRKVARTFQGLPRNELAVLLGSPIHEDRLTALIILTYQYERADESERATITRFYRTHLDAVNNWDLVDLSSHKVLGEQVAAYGGEDALYRLAKSHSLWRRRVAIVSTFAYLRRGEVRHSCALVELLLNDKEDLIHKAAGWVLREMGKVDKQALVQFLGDHAPEMPRTMLRYAIERFPEQERKKWLTVRAL